MKKTIFAVSDIHGHADLLKEALKNAGFDPKNEKHLLIVCGDCFDRGDQNMQVLQYLDRIDNKVLLRGNHEDMLLEIFESGIIKPHNFVNGTIQTLVELFGKYAIDGDRVDFSGKSRILDRAAEFMEQQIPFFASRHFVFTHGWLPTVPDGETVKIHPDWQKGDGKQWKAARWTKWTDMYLTCDRLPDKTSVCGHVPTFRAVQFDPRRGEMQADIFYGDGVIVLDGGTFTTGVINVLKVCDEV